MSKKDSSNEQKIVQMSKKNRSNEQKIVLMSIKNIFKRIKNIVKISN